MPVIDTGAIQPKPNITVEASTDPETVEFDDGHGLKGKDMVDLSDPETVDHADLHTPRSLDLFEPPGPVTVVLDGYGLKGESTGEQVKLVKPKQQAKPSGTKGAETK